MSWLFPGQGSQTVGMAKDIFHASKAAKELFLRADEVLQEKLSELMFEGPIEKLTLTAHAQPAILVASVAILFALKERLPQLPSPSFAAGHSLGEYSALVATGSLGFEDAVKLVRVRGKAMQQAVAPGLGAMAAVMGMEAKELELICLQVTNDLGEKEVCSCANYNTPNQIVISGHKRAVTSVAEAVTLRGAKAIMLNVSAPFHCALMSEAAAPVEDMLRNMNLGEMAFPVVANVNALPIPTASHIPSLLVQQVSKAVRWEESIRYMYSAGMRTALEIGPGKVLGGMVKRIQKDVNTFSICDLPSMDAYVNQFGT